MRGEAENADDKAQHFEPGKRIYKIQKYSNIRIVDNGEV
jgi:hypothetical protein